jgi:hypothetical protein
MVKQLLLVHQPQLRILMELLVLDLFLKVQVLELHLGLLVHQMLTQRLVLHLLPHHKIMDSQLQVLYLLPLLVQVLMDKLLHLQSVVPKQGQLVK